MEIKIHTDPLYKKMGAIGSIKSLNVVNVLQT